MLVDFGVLGMELLAHVAGAFAVAALLIHVATSLSTAWRCRRSAEPRPSREPEQGAAVTIIRPVCGLDAYEEATLRSTFALDYPAARSPALLRLRAAIPWCRWCERLIAEHPHVRGAPADRRRPRLARTPSSTTSSRAGARPSHGWIAIADSNVLMPPDYLQRLFATWRHGTGLVSRAADRLRGLPTLLGRARVRLPQHLPGALAVRRRQPRATASRRARRCSGGASTWSAPAASMRWPPRLRRGCGLDQGRARRRACACAWSMAPSPQPLGMRTLPERLERGSCAGRACGGRPSRSSIRAGDPLRARSRRWPAMFAAQRSVLDLPEVLTGAAVRRACGSAPSTWLDRQRPAGRCRWRSPLLWLLRELAAAGAVGCSPGSATD